jgi:ferric-dicitrate binding protein FerR (iron transport regulator)
MDNSINDIIQKAKESGASVEQQDEFLSLFWQADKEYALKEFLFDDLVNTAASENRTLYFNDLFEKFWIRRRIENKSYSPKRRSLVLIAQWAAILVVGLLLGSYFDVLKKTEATKYYTSITPKGSVSQMILPDGTQVFMNAGTQIKYSVNGSDNNREVFLAGEAWFQVAKMKDKPFLVHTSTYDIWVTGTSFNVKAYPDEKDVTTTLEEGHIAVKSSEKLNLTEEILLKPGEQLIYNTESKDIQVHEVNTKWYTSWKDNKLVFVNMSLKDLTVLLERKYGVEIEIGDRSILDYHYDGTIKDETIFEVLEILKRTLPIQYHIVNQKIIIQKNN